MGRGVYGDYLGMANVETQFALGTMGAGRTTAPCGGTLHIQRPYTNWSPKRPRIGQHRT